MQSNGDLVAGTTSPPNMETNPEPPAVADAAVCATPASTEPPGPELPASAGTSTPEAPASVESVPNPPSSAQGSAPEPPANEVSVPEPPASVEAPIPVPPEPAPAEVQAAAEPVPSSGTPVKAQVHVCLCSQRLKESLWLSFAPIPCNASDLSHWPQS